MWMSQVIYFLFPFTFDFHLINIDITANLSTLPSEYPVGRNIWNISSDEGCGLSTVELTFSVCNETQFTCNNGLCVHLERR